MADRCRYNAKLKLSNTPGKKWDAIKCGLRCQQGHRFCPHHETVCAERLGRKIAKEAAERVWAA